MKYTMRSHSSLWLAVAIVLMASGEHESGPGAA